LIAPILCHICYVVGVNDLQTEDSEFESSRRNIVYSSPSVSSACTACFQAILCRFECISE